jgi:hypothetical protein
MSWPSAEVNQSVQNRIETTTANGGRCFKFVERFKAVPTAV